PSMAHSAKPILNARPIAVPLVVSRSVLAAMLRRPQAAACGARLPVCSAFDLVCARPGAARARSSYRACKNHRNARERPLMLKASTCVAALVCALATPAAAQMSQFQPVTDAVLANPDPSDWLMINRTFDEQRFSPLNQINKSNVGQL